jgi:formate dehydrogenase beta subunit
MELGEPDASGRRRPIPVKGSEFVLKTDMVLPAIGEVPDLAFLQNQIELTKWGTVKVEPSHQTSQPWLFSGGDCVTGPATIIEAIAAGNRAARSIDQYLRQGKLAPSEADLVENLLHQVALSRQRNGGVIDRRPRQSPEQLSLADRALNFNEVEKCFTTEEVTREAERCLRCYRVMLLATS